ncbi:hypothetical protein A0H81_12935 [Grifola frondosa]|uniref:F-box domain-containing protein n=1 Tax=Grifola frondosa TaxID=5627 RepID=A0A1C7LT11_GRIFR|nr:hypothetical protein A0H81_12935 [Grifola frondosa]
MASSLAVELINHIMEYLYYDPDALRACSLTSRMWLFPSQLQLFNSVTLTDLRSLRKFGDLMRTSPRIAKLVRELCIDAHAASLGRDSQTWVRSVAPACLLPRRAAYAAVPLRELERSSSRRRLSPEHTHVHVCDGSALSGGQFSTHPNARSPGVFLSKALKALSGFALRLTGLTIGPFCPLKDICRLFRHTRIHTHLRRVEFPRVDYQEVPAVDTLLALIGPDLLHFKIGCAFECPPSVLEWLSDNVDFSRNTRLRSLEFTVIDNRSEAMGWIPFILSQVASTNTRLSRIVFNVSILFDTQMQHSEWQKIEAILSYARLWALTEVIFVRRGGLDMESFRWVMRNRFAELEVRNLLHVQDGGDWTKGERVRP